MNENGDEPADAGFIVPAPFSVIVTLVALPPKVFPLTVTGVVPHTLPLRLVSVRAGGLAHPQFTLKLLPVVVHPDAFLTVIVWFPFATPVKVALIWYIPASIL